MAKLGQAFGAPSPFRSFDPVRFGGSSRLTFKRLRRPTPLPTLLPMIAASGAIGRFVARLNGLFGR